MPLPAGDRTLGRAAAIRVDAFGAGGQRVGAAVSVAVGIDRVDTRASRQEGPALTRGHAGGNRIVGRGEACRCETGEFRFQRRKCLVKGEPKLVAKSKETLFEGRKTTQGGKWPETARAPAPGIAAQVQRDGPEPRLELARPMKSKAPRRAPFRSRRCWQVNTKASAAASVSRSTDLAVCSNSGANRSRTRSRPRRRRRAPVRRVREVDRRGAPRADASSTGPASQGPRGNCGLRNGFVALARLAREGGAHAASAFGAGFGGSVWRWWMRLTPRSSRAPGSAPTLPAIPSPRRDPRDLSVGLGEARGHGREA